MSIRLKRAYDEPTADDGYRVLIDRMWPRGVSKDQLELDEWLKEIAPSRELREWFDHDPDKWDEFRKRYRQELKGKPELVAGLASRAAKGRLTLVFGARDRAHNNAVALEEYLKKQR